MKFCSQCGSYMKKTKNGFMCRKCGDLIQANSRKEVSVAKIDHPNLVSIVDDAETEHEIVPQECPRCRNNEAFRWFSRISGEHAGIRRERTIEHFRCTRCSHSWGKTS